jgi:hypothetical protein
MKGLERESARLERVVVELTLDKQILKEAAEGEYQARASPDLCPPCAGRAWRLRTPSVPHRWSAVLDTTSCTPRPGR